MNRVRLDLPNIISCFGTKDMNPYIIEITIHELTTSNKLGLLKLNEYCKNSKIVRKGLKNPCSISELKMKKARSSIRLDELASW